MHLVLRILRNLVRRIDKNGILTTIVGSGEKGYSGDGGSPRQASLNLPHEIRFGPDGKLYIVDMGNLSSGVSIFGLIGSKRSRGPVDQGTRVTVAQRLKPR